MADDDVLVDVQGLSKIFCRDLKRSLWYATRDIVSEMVGRGCDRTRLRKSEFFPIRDLSFQWRRGERIGLIGRNGAGKTTLLRLLNGLIRPDSGRITIRGRVGALIALGTGFNPVLTGRENVYINAAVLGFSKRQTRRKFDDIIAFAELEQFVDTPVRSYSSGMLARLGFAVATQLEPDILLIDEVLAVGDIAFRAKCYRHLANLSRKGTTFVLVSHNPHSIMSICDRGMLLREGRLIAQGPVESVLRTYEASLSPDDPAATRGRLDRPRPAGSTGPWIASLLLRDAAGRQVDQLQVGEAGSICAVIETDRDIDEASLGVVLSQQLSGGEMKVSLTAAADKRWQRLAAGRSEYRMTMPVVCLPPGAWSAKCAINEMPFATLDVVESFRFTVQASSPLGNSTFYQPRQWTVSDARVVEEAVTVTPHSTNASAP